MGLASVEIVWLLNGIYQSYWVKLEEACTRFTADPGYRLNVPEISNRPATAQVAQARPNRQAALRLRLRNAILILQT